MALTRAFNPSSRRNGCLVEQGARWCPCTTFLGTCIPNLLILLQLPQASLSLTMHHAMGPEEQRVPHVLQVTAPQGGWTCPATHE